MSAISLFQQTTSIFVTRRHNSISGKDTQFYCKTSTSFTWQIYGWAPLLSTCMWSFKRNCYGNLNLVTSWLFDIWWKGKLPGPDDRCPPKLILNPKPREISFALSIHFICPIVSKFCTEHGSATVVLRAKFQTDWATEDYVTENRDFARFELKRSFDGISHPAPAACRPASLPFHVFCSLVANKS